MAKFRKIKSVSVRGKLMKECDELFSKYIRGKRGNICEIHWSSNCDQIGIMHILSKQDEPRLRYYEDNVVCAGWFCSHYYTHQNSDDPRAEFARQRILEIKGAKTWDDLTARLRAAKKDMDKHDTLYLEALKVWLKQELE